ncbi:hypothetical protein AMJ85_08325 [candidate division BRC1 bacterium SM23_51]|nr:MAG: hypothetical protein AMJ85_08325 [candidate division BRC1 bacterium SM23_51]
MSQCDLRVGVVHHLNTKPLIFGLQSLAPALRVRAGAPSQLASWLRAGQLDVALVPVLEYFSRPDYGLIAESAICGDGRVRSVLLFSRVPVERARSVSLDPESLTSNALIKVLCQKRFSIEPTWVARSQNDDPSIVLKRGGSDAAVVIGNAALAMSGRFAYEYDLGQEWWHLTGLPFVFAVWAVRRGAETGDLAEVLRCSLRLGLAHLDLIADEAARSLDLDPTLCRTYLRQMIHYDLTDRAKQGMGLFFKMCAEMGICPSSPPPDLAQWLNPPFGGR